MQELKPFEKVMYQALLEHHRTHSHSEWYYVQALGCARKFSDCSQKRRALASMLKEFGIARCLRKKGKSDRVGSGFSSLVALLDGSHLRGDDTGFWGKKSWEQIICSAEGKNSDNQKLKTAKGSFASGLTKVTWFVYKHKLPMFDRYTKKAMGAKGATANKQVLDFYDKIDTEAYKDFHNHCRKLVDELSKTERLGWMPSPERMFDKALMFKGAKQLGESPSMLADSRNLCSYANLCDSSGSLRALAVHIAEYFSKDCSIKDPLRVLFLP